MAYVAIDLGASVSRYAADDREVSTLENSMKVIDVDEVTDLACYGNDITSKLDVTISFDKESQYFPVRVLMGALAERYTSVLTRPSTLTNKHVQQVNYVSAVLAVALARYNEKIPPNITVYLALPPVEAKSAKEIVKNNLEGSYTVKFNAVGKEVSFTIDEVRIFEESFMALTSYFFDVTGAPKQKAMQYANGNILSLDIGASTTDLAIVKDMVYQEKSGQTYKIGGNVARDSLMDSIREIEGYDMTQEAADTVIREGRIQQGNSYKVCGDLVCKAKKKLAEAVTAQIQEYFRKVGIPLQNIRAIIVSGGGSMAGSYLDNDSNSVETSEPTSIYITEELRKVCSTIDIQQHDNPRLANINGLLVRATLDEVLKKDKEG